MSSEKLVEVCQNDINALLGANPITFKRGKTELEDTMADIVLSIGDLMAECAGLHIEVQGHTDSRGAENLNLQLSQERADAVLQALEESGLVANKITAVGYGEAQPIADNNTADGRAKNRRIELRVFLP